MNIRDKTTVVINAIIQAPVEKVWHTWTNPDHITQWYFASDEWHCPGADNDMQLGGQFRIRMEAKDGSMGFDFSGEYTQIVLNQKIVYQLDDERWVKINFTDLGNETQITQTFEVDDSHSIELQKNGWQAILNNFKKYVEELK